MVSSRVISFAIASLVAATVDGFVAPSRNVAFLSATAIASTSTDAEVYPQVKVGDKIPDVTMMEGSPEYGPPKEVKLGELIAGKKVAIFGVPGAFTPGCSKSHLPSFIEAQEELKAKGVELTICVATNDAFVMEVSRHIPADLRVDAWCCRMPVTLFLSASSLSINHKHSHMCMYMHGRSSIFFLL